jgi:hypothetical protein
MWDVSGLECNDPKLSLKVVFHAIVPLPHWELDDNPHLFIRFDHRKFGNGKENCGKFRVAR